MYDVDGNGVIDLEEMTKIVQAIYDMLGAGAVKPTDTAEERAKNIFTRWVEKWVSKIPYNRILRIRIKIMNDIKVLCRVDWGPFEGEQIMLSSWRPANKYLFWILILTDERHIFWFPFDNQNKSLTFPVKTLKFSVF